MMLGSPIIQAPFAVKWGQGGWGPGARVCRSKGGNGGVTGFIDTQSIVEGECRQKAVLEAKGGRGKTQHYFASFALSIDGHSES